MKRPMKLFSIITSVMVLLPASLAIAQQTTPESSPPMQMESPVATSPNEQSAQSMQKMDKMSDSVTKMSAMCQMMMTKETASMPYIMAAGITFGVVLFLDLLFLVILEIQWIISWARRLKR